MYKDYKKNSYTFRSVAVSIRRSFDCTESKSTLNSQMPYQLGQRSKWGEGGYTLPQTNICVFLYIFFLDYTSKT